MTQLEKHVNQRIRVDDKEKQMSKSAQKQFTLSGNKHSHQEEASKQRE